MKKINIRKCRLYLISLYLQHSKRNRIKLYFTIKQYKITFADKRTEIAQMYRYLEQKIK